MGAGQSESAQPPIDDRDAAWTDADWQGGDSRWLAAIVARDGDPRRRACSDARADVVNDWIAC